MYGRLFSYLCCFILITSINLTMSVTAHSQTSDASPASAEAGKPSGDLDFQKADKEAVEKLRKMPPEKVATLDDKLAEALTLYYDGKFAQALPIFNSISADVETMDIMW